jgi:hypothetical protein
VTTRAQRQRQPPHSLLDHCHRLRILLVCRTPTHVRIRPPPPRGIKPLHDQVHVACDPSHHLVRDRLNIWRRVIPTTDLVPDRDDLAGQVSLKQCLRHRAIVAQPNVLICRDAGD